MTPERFRKIEELYHAAREGTPEERAALLAQTDPELRREVELLLQVPSGGEFLNQPAVQNAPELMEDSTVTGLAADTLLGPYRIESKLGEGGMGEVFRAVDTRLGRPVAIKFSHAKFNSRFEREARAIAMLNHPNICTLYDIGPNYLVMELLDGETIASRLKNGPLPVDEAVRYASQIAGALAEAHALGIVHRDLKPGNIMLVKSGVKVLDFGLATWEGDDTITGSNMVIGTPAYMAPEQRLGMPSDVRTDIYSFGCIVYEMLTAERATAERKALPSKSLESIVSRCLEADPARRWQSSVELASALEGPLRAEKKRTGLLPSIAIAALVVAIGIGAFLHFRAAAKPKDKYTVVLADFVNNTSDASFDSTLRQALAAQLEPASFLKIMDDDQVHRTLRFMTLAPDARVTKPIAQEICIRQGAAASIDGTVASLGKNYVITLQAIACENGATLARDQVQAEDKEDVVKALRTVTTAVRNKLGESLDSIEKPKHPLQLVTTRSLEALQNYTEGYYQLSGTNYLSASQSLERATAIDPDFAMGYYCVAVTAENAGDMARLRVNAKRAFDLRDRVSEFERDHIVPLHYRATGEAYKEIDADQESIRNFPEFWGFHNQLSVAAIDIGDFALGLKEGEESARVTPAIDASYRRILDSYLCLNRFQEAKELEKKLRLQNIGGPRVHQRFLEMAYMAEDQAAIATEVQWFADKVEEYISLGLQAAYLNLHGQRRESQKMFERAADVAKRREYWSNAGVELENGGALAAALSGDCAGARRLGRPALALALCGDEVRAKALMAETDKLFPNGVVWQKVQRPTIQAAIALVHSQPEESVSLLASAGKYEGAYPEAIYLRGRAYLLGNKAPEAVAEFRKIVDNKGFNWASGWRTYYQGQFYSLSYLYLARAYKMEKEMTDAKKAYQAFFELWKKPDSDIRLYQDAKAEYAKLP